MRTMLKTAAVAAAAFITTSAAIAEDYNWPVLAETTLRANADTIATTLREMNRICPTLPSRSRDTCHKEFMAVVPATLKFVNANTKIAIARMENQPNVERLYAEADAAKAVEKRLINVLDKYYQTSENSRTRVGALEKK